MTVKISPSILDDLEYLPAAERSAGLKYHEYHGTVQPPDERTLPRKTLDRAHSNGGLFVAKDGKQCVGFIAAVSLENSFHIEEVSVVFGNQNKGIGKRLIDAILDEAKKRTYNAVSLTADCKIPWTYPFYQRLGFKDIGLSECSPLIANILVRDKERNPNPDNRVAMIYILRQT